MGNVKYTEPTSFEDMEEQDATPTTEPNTPSPVVETDETTE